MPDKEFQLPLRFRLTDADGDLVRSFRIHKDGLGLGPRTGPKPVYIFPLTARVRDADGLMLTVRLVADGVGRIEFAN